MCLLLAGSALFGATAVARAAHLLTDFAVLGGTVGFLGPLFCRSPLSGLEVHHVGGAAKAAIRVLALEPGSEFRDLVRHLFGVDLEDFAEALARFHRKPGRIIPSMGDDPEERLFGRFLARRALDLCPGDLEDPIGDGIIEIHFGRLHREEGAALILDADPTADRSQYQKVFAFRNNPELLAGDGFAVFPEHCALVDAASARRPIGAVLLDLRP